MIDEETENKNSKTNTSDLPPVIDEKATAARVALLQRALVERPLQPVGGGEHLLYENVMPAFLQCVQLAGELREARSTTVEGETTGSTAEEAVKLEEKLQQAKNELKNAFDKVRLVMSVMESLAEGHTEEAPARKRGRADDVEEEKKGKKRME
ncbi:hypothetical protein AGDE_15005 [Angomonas deanei]|uniref:Uncharacterized protein n=1 Tax=Angomonas deanei TaxID=59799 RepID=A0A7G2CK16_9TRYP|nr:hypothetical protein AGDE_15005 [Angomonas deanei]CAD2220208.1 hypothetical protein, conserved [Angomonas deanei]|eukprot:EPY19848.1 hypothetical protein AGDE_15005 [Angomonas deanei]